MPLAVATWVYSAGIVLIIILFWGVLIPMITRPATRFRQSLVDLATVAELLAADLPAPTSPRVR